MIINVKVKPNSKKEEIIDLDNGNFEVYLKEKAEDGKANLKLIKLLSKKFDVNYKQISIKNSTSRNKLIEIK
jgi:uncharacterized protein (TIGR00251 family)